MLWTCTRGVPVSREGHLGRLVGDRFGQLRGRSTPRAVAGGRLPARARAASVLDKPIHVSRARRRRRALTPRVAARGRGGRAESRWSSEHRAAGRQGAGASPAQRGGRWRQRDVRELRVTLACSAGETLGRALTPAHRVWRATRQAFTVGHRLRRPPSARWTSAPCSTGQGRRRSACWACSSATAAALRSPHGARPPARRTPDSDLDFKVGARRTQARSAYTGLIRIEPTRAQQRGLPGEPQPAAERERRARRRFPSWRSSSTRCSARTAPPSVRSTRTSSST